jgi:hypothetical protein
MYKNVSLHTGLLIYSHLHFINTNIPSVAINFNILLEQLGTKIPVENRKVFAD